jgi:RNA polymerase sigma-70 factor (sigma-E family)
VTFEEFAEARLQALLRYATVLCGDPHLAQDLVQDVLVRVHSRWQRIEQYDVPEQYVRRAIANGYVSWRRRWSVRNLVPFGSPPELPFADPTQESTERSELWRQLSILPRRQRAVLVLRYYEGLSDTEIAEVFGCSPGTVRGHASRALATLRGELAGDRLADQQGAK